MSTNFIAAPRLATWIPVCPACGEGRVLVAPMRTRSRELEPLNVNESLDCYCDHCAYAFPLTGTKWRCL
jgi:hypothetical protein